jgi:hypothetical protein
MTTVVRCGIGSLGTDDALTVADSLGAAGAFGAAGDFDDDGL